MGAAEERLAELLHTLRHRRIADSHFAQGSIEVPEEGVGQVPPNLVGRRRQSRKARRASTM